MDNPTRRLPDVPLPDSDHPTRRLPDAPPPQDPLADYRVSAVDSQPLNPLAHEPMGRLCLRCKMPMRGASVGAESQSVYGVLRTPVSAMASLRLKVGTAQSTCTAWVCPACGYLELVADSPSALFGNAFLDRP